MVADKYTIQAETLMKSYRGYTGKLMKLSQLMLI